MYLMHAANFSVVSHAHIGTLQELPKLIFKTSRSSAQVLQAVATAETPRHVVMTFDEVLLKILTGWSLSDFERLDLSAIPAVEAKWEPLMIRGMAELDNNAAPCMAKLWVHTTPQQHVHKITSAVLNTSPTQRFLYTLLSMGPHLQDHSNIQHVLEQTPFQDFSDTLVHLAYETSYAIDYPTPNLHHHALKLLHQPSARIPRKNILSFTLLNWMQRYFPEQLEQDISKTSPFYWLREQVCTVRLLHSCKIQLSSLHTPWVRYLAKAEQVRKWIHHIQKSADHTQEELWSQLQGFRYQQLQNATLPKKASAPLQSMCQLLARNMLPPPQEQEGSPPTDKLLPAAINMLAQHPEFKHQRYYQMFANTLTPDSRPEDVNQAHQEVRKAEDWLKCIWLATLAYSPQKSHATMRALEFLTSPIEQVRIACIETLAKLGQHKGGQELIYCLTRKNYAPQQLKIAELLEHFDMYTLSGELRSCIHDIQQKPQLTPNQQALVDILSEYLQPEDLPEPLTPETDKSIQSQNETLLFPFWEELSTPVKRALRTALYFYEQVMHHKDRDLMDLAPIMDMQYKAIEIYFREHFETTCLEVIKRGNLQRTLDILGYARPIQDKMDKFEGYLQARPYINQIPYFSKVKLRKILRAICSYRPGRRFTLDGVKAYALFLLTFARKSCPFGLENTLPISVDDESLFQYCALLHEYQDIRNRATHEGVQFEQQQELEQVWRCTANILEFARKLEVQPQR
ncbi:MAG: hypothetical protein OXT67_06800 [Zetaproteobacteria bacterium]|nr:hypothetical protein [Zetaproteobacteria bacterium]